MKVKLIFSVLIGILMLVSMSQMFSIPPYAGDVFSIYKSGYFNELDREFEIITDSFLGIKAMARPEYAWIFLSDIETAHKITIKVYDYQGYQIKAPGEKSKDSDSTILGIMNAMNPRPVSQTSGITYRSVLPVKIRGQCKFCHSRWNTRDVLGALSYERSYNAMIYYSAERIIIFLCITIMLGGLLYAVLRWDPGKNIKELFDK